MIQDPDAAHEATSIDGKVLSGHRQARGQEEPLVDPARAALLSGERVNVKEDTVRNGGAEAGELIVEMGDCFGQAVREVGVTNLAQG